MRVVIIVLGEIAQSPRMQYHARALADHGAEVEVVAYADRPVPSKLREHPRIKVRPVGSPRAKRHELARPLFIAYAIARSLVVAASLVRRLLANTHRPDVILVQNPPAIPSLAVAVLAARLRGARLVIDWHNYGWSMMALRLGDAHPLVKLARWHEGACGRRADFHLCVSRAMSEDLASRWRIREASVLYDLPPHDVMQVRSVRGTDVEHSARASVLRELGASAEATDAGSRALLVSPTSWTADEDFSLLLTALGEYERRCAHAPPESPGHYPGLLVALTGQGPLRGRYEREFARRPMRHVELVTGWLDAPRYAELLAVADLGICLHRSSSGLDLPMKIADMLAAGLPVCAYDYGPCLREQVEPGETGLLFTSGQQLAERLAELLCGFPSEASDLFRLRRGIRERHQKSWEDGWSEVARPRFGLPPAPAPPRVQPPVPTRG